MLRSMIVALQVGVWVLVVSLSFTSAALVPTQAPAIETDIARVLRLARVNADMHMQVWRRCTYFGYCFGAPVITDGHAHTQDLAQSFAGDSGSGVAIHGTQISENFGFDHPRIHGSSIKLLVVTGVVIPIFVYACFSQAARPTLIIVCWMLASFGMVVLNKEAASTFEATCLLIIIQMACTDVVFLFGYRKMTFRLWSDLAKWAIVPFTFAAIMATSLYAMKETTMSTVLILHNAMPFFAFVMEKHMFNVPAKITWALVISMLLALAGTVIYGVSNVSVTLLGALLITVNCIVTIADRFIQRCLLMKSEFSVSLPLCMMINNVIGIVPIMVLAAATGEISSWKGTVQGATSTTWMWVVLSGICGIFLGYLGLRVQEILSATSSLMFQNLNKLFTVLFGMLMMGDHIVGISFVGCVISMLGSFWYGYLRLPSETASGSARATTAARESAKEKNEV